MAASVETLSRPILRLARNTLYSVLIFSVPVVFLLGNHKANIDNSYKIWGEKSLIAKIKLI